MTRILTRRELEEKKYPSSEDLKTADNKIRSVLTDLKDKGTIIGSTSYGSFYDRHKRTDIASDIDWMVIFSSLEQMMESEEFADLLVFLNELNVPFYNPIISIENIESGNHIIAPILHCIRINTGRVIIGKDPVDIFKENGVTSKNIRIISRLFASYTRYFYEEVTKYPLAKKNDEVLVRLLQLAINFFGETYRTMITLKEDTESRLDSTISYENYAEYYALEIDENIIKMGFEVIAFMIKYKEMINVVLSSRSTKEVLDEYDNFLRRHKYLVDVAARFCRENINHFRSLYLKDEHKS